MSEVKRRRYPKNAARLHELRIRLESEIAERQEILAEVRKLEANAEKEEIVNMVKAYNVTPEELTRLVNLLRDQLPGKDNTPHEQANNPAVPIAMNTFEIETEENEDE